MEVLECIRTRRSVRRYTDETIAEEVIESAEPGDDADTDTDSIRLQEESVQ